jgi:hypothetical protein
VQAVRTVQAAREELAQPAPMAGQPAVSGGTP